MIRKLSLRKIFKLNFWLVKAWWLLLLFIKTPQIETYTSPLQRKLGIASKLIHKLVKCKPETLKNTKVEKQTKLIILYQLLLLLSWEEDTLSWLMNQVLEQLSLIVNSIYSLLWKMENLSLKSWALKITTRKLIFHSVLSKVVHCTLLWKRKKITVSFWVGITKGLRT